MRGGGVRVGGVRVVEVLRAHSAELEREFDDHDPVAFTRRLAERLAAARRPTPAVRERPARPPAGARPPHAPAAGPNPGAGTAVGAGSGLGWGSGPGSGPGGGSGVGPGVGPGVGSGPASGQPPWGGGRAELRRDLRHLCAGVTGAVEAGELALDLELAEKTAFRTLGCLLYGLGRAADGVFWWRIAAQYGDQLAVHCLAVHYTAEGERHDAARWAAQAQDLSAPGRLPDLAPDVRPGGAAELARVLAERYDGEILLTLREALAARPRAEPVRLGVRAVRGRGVVRIR
ncbi:hypothetical protein BX285_7135 [Streptomyces sp. 1114.5]|uniref:hypothetical protein n=1 Tax=Streptomyces sp. 1114.5 TaxID=1938830 RepID=UPI000F2A2425|nr:hypothetical protein [Streptomyces sp. 1114.5]RKT08769.1 hypothetical protein BX285_7135 [Streptomyces sp. 1114.5]